jgi:hypothetical protein
MIQTKEKVLIADPINGFTERDANSKAILNTDLNSLLKYRIQKRKTTDINKNKEDINEIYKEVDQIKNDIREIKDLLLTIAGK